MIEEAEHRLGVRLPPELAAFHRNLGACAELLDAHNTILTLEELESVEGHLLIAEENQSVVSWGIPLGALDDPDPLVWQRVNDEAATWYSEEQGVVDFFRGMLDWTFGVEPPTAD